MKVDDKDELNAAYESGELTEEQYISALAEGDAIISEFCGDIKETNELCGKVRRMVEQRISAGEPIKKCKEVIALGSK